jgi:hypothetical protein
MSGLEGESVVAMLLRRVCVGSGILCIALLLTALDPHTVGAAWDELRQAIDASSTGGPEIATSDAKSAEKASKQLQGLDAQQQAEMLLQDAIGSAAHLRESGTSNFALEQIHERLGRWDGRLQLTPRLATLLQVALNCDDREVRAASLDLYLAAYGIPRTPQGAARLRERIAVQPASRPWALWMLGALGNRGVEPDQALAALLTYLRDPSEETRYWAVEGLGVLGSDGTIQSLLDVLHEDPSAKVKERAACTLAQSGLLTREQRMKAVPRLLDFAADPSFDASAHLWIFQALTEITGAREGNNAVAWRQWWTEHNHS